MRSLILYIDYFYKYVFEDLKYILYFLSKNYFFFYEVKIYLLLIIGIINLGLFENSLLIGFYIRKCGNKWEKGESKICMIRDI